MGTRGIILVTGYHERGVQKKDQFCSVRLYEHWDGSPDTVLGQLADATRFAQEYLDRKRDYAEFCARRAPVTVADLPAIAFAYHVIHAGVGFAGPAIRIDREHGERGRPEDEGGGTYPYTYPAIFSGHQWNDDTVVWGEQGDLEWVWRVNLPERTVTCWGMASGSPQDIVAHGPVDPRIHATELRDDEPYQQRAFLGISRGVAALERMGWHLTPPRSKAKRWAQKLEAKSWAFLNETLKDAPHADEFLPAVRRQVGDATPLVVWADKLDDDGHGEWSKKIRKYFPAA
jgi:hypothetical protein